MADNRVAEPLRKPYAGGLQSGRARSGKCVSWHLALLSLIIKFRDNTKVLLFLCYGFALFGGRYRQTLGVCRVFFAG